MKKLSLVLFVLLLPAAVGAQTVIATGSTASGSTIEVIETPGSPPPPPPTGGGQVNAPLELLDAAGDVFARFAEDPVDGHVFDFGLDSRFRWRIADDEAGSRQVLRLDATAADIVGLACAIGNNECSAYWSQQRTIEGDVEALNLNDLGTLFMKEFINVSKWHRLIVGRVSANQEGNIFEAITSGSAGISLMAIDGVGNVVSPCRIYPDQDPAPPQVDLYEWNENGVWMSSTTGCPVMPPSTPLPIQLQEKVDAAFEALKEWEASKE